MLPVWPNSQVDDPAVIRRDLVRFAQQFGPSSVSKLLGNVSLGVGETPVAHGMGAPPHWRLYDVQADARVWQSRASDATFIYLTASAAVIVGIEVF
ncbi:MAG TPA: hypothetical protein VFJ24_11915 [Gaiellales bacterium]|nr:hypothetical protein [Gaiellales bacterium]